MLIRRLFVVSVLILGLIKLASAQAKGIGDIQRGGNASTGTVRAIIVGISNYKNVQKLTYAHTDALAFYRFLISPAGGRIDSNNIIILLNEQATAARIYAALDAMVDVTQPGDEIIFYFSGHGDLETKTIRQNGFLLGYDAPNAAYMSGGTIGVNYLQDYLMTLAEKNKAKVILITDACRSGKLAGGIEGVKMTTAALQEQWQNITKVLSSQAGELSYEDKKWGNGGGGIFTHYLLRGLKGLADMNTDYKVTVSELLIYMMQTIPKETKFVQNPNITGDMTAVLSYVDSLTLAALINEVPGQQEGGQLAFKGFEDKLTEGLDSTVLKAYQNFELCITKDILINPDEQYGCAWDIYQSLINNEKAAPIIGNMRRTLLAALQDKAQTAINLYVEGKDIPDSLDFDQAYKELEYAVNMIDETYILYNHIKARYLLIKGGVYEDDIQVKIKLVNEALALEPDAPFGYFLLGSAYYDDKKYEESYKNYMKTLALAPRWAYAWNNLGTVYTAWLKHDSAEYFYKKAIEFKVDMPEPYYNLGLTYYNLGKYDLAIEYHDKCLVLKPDYPKSYNNKGWCYYDQGKYDKALEFFAKASEFDYENKDYKTSLGKTYIKLKDYDNAIKYLRAALKIDENHKLAIYYLGQAYEEKGDFDKAIYYYKRCMINDTSYNFVLKSIAGIYNYNLKQYDIALDYYNQYITFYPNESSVYVNLGNMYFNQDKYDEAIPYYRKAFEIDPKYTKPILFTGQCHYHMGRYKEAMAFFDKCLEVDSAYVDAYLEKARVFRKQEKYDLAQEQYLAGYAMDTSRTEMIYKIGDIYYVDIEDYETAVSWYEKYLLLEPGSYDAHIDAGNSWYYLKEYQKALLHYTAAVAIDSSYRSAYLNMGNTYLNLEDLESAEKFYWKAVQVDKCYALAYYNIGDLYVTKEKYTDAIRYYLEAIRCDSTYEYLTYTIGTIYMNKLARYEDAESYFNRYILYNPESYNGYTGLGYVYLKSGKTKKSEQYFEKALEMNPNEPWCYYNFACFYSLTGNKQKALEYLEKALLKNFDQFDHIATDTDLDAIRNMPEFNAIINKYRK